jgi:hypothetical protein
MRQRFILTLWLSATAVVLGAFDKSYVKSLNDDDDCLFHDLTPAVSAVLCAVERRAWSLPSDSSTVTNAGCLLGANRCDSVRHVPTANEVLSEYIHILLVNLTFSTSQSLNLSTDHITITSTIIISFLALII